jgi:hypothetical protein
MASSPLQRLPLDGAPESHGNDTALSPNMPSADVARSPLTPSDCHTLKKILQDVQSPSRAASPLPANRNERHLGIDVTDDGSSDMNNEDGVKYTKKQHDYGDEADEGYEDEDESMLLRDNSTCECVWSNGDTIEDIRNTLGKTAPPALEQNFGGVYLHDQPKSDETKKIELQRAAVEEVLEGERADQERQDVVTIGDQAISLNAAIMEDQDDAAALSGDLEFQAGEAVQAEIGMSFVDEYLDGAMEVKVSCLIPKA